MRDSKNSRLAVLARINQIEKVEAISTEHSYACNTRLGAGDCLLAEFVLNTEKMSKQSDQIMIECRSQKLYTLILKGLCPNMLLDLENDRYMVDDYIVDQWEVVGRL